MMTATQFDESLRRHIRKKPFQPFPVVLTNGTTLTIDRADAVGFQNGAGTFIDADGELHFFNDQLVQAIGNDATPESLPSSS